jgi:hypothetical protein
MLVRVHIQGVIRTSLGACFAPNAAAVVKIDYAVLACKQRGHRADLNAGSIRAVIAPHYGKKAPRVGELALFYVLDPGAVNPDRHVMLCLACNRAGMAADTLPVIDNEPEIHR